MSRSSCVRFVVCLVLAALVVIPAASASARSRSVAHGSSYYLSLGDSLAFGYQPNLVAKGDYNPSDYRSYAEDYAAVFPSLQLVNFGCPGETTTTLVAGGCPWPQAALHNAYAPATSQLGAATAFLTAHGSQTSLVTIDIGSNDLLALETGCAGSLMCVQNGLGGALGTIETNYAVILATVHALAPSARVVVFNLYNPLAITVPGSDTLLTVVNQALAGFAASEHVQLANAFGAINGTAGSWLEPARVCLFTWECTSYANIHPNGLGYAALTLALAGAH